MPHPLIDAGAKRSRFGKIQRALLLQVIGKKRRKNFAPIVSAGGAAEIDLPKLSAIAARPAAVIPGADDQKILMRGIVFFEQLIDLEGAVEIFLIPPAGDVQRRHGDAIQPWREALALPE